MLTAPHGNEGGGVAAGEVLGLSQCLDSAAGGDAVKLVNPVETGISPAGGGRRGRGGWWGCRSLSLRTVPRCGGTPHLYAAPPPLRKPAPGAV